ncbi:hypothetical protein ANN_04062 [Periplaneta americana]|uniref:Uncharacterized protein n=1 Tax=Periplaneta americana TaxID=6978 RepID=A0ABQ8T8R0_PERAM|nr:hypothetical protein ANN_04062 [Periplaneta americana]
MTEVFLEIVDNLFDGFKNKNEIKAAIRDLQLSRRTVARQVEDISANLEEQLQKDVVDCEAFSLQLDESVDVSDTVQILIFIHIVFQDFTIKEEFLADFTGTLSEMNVELQGNNKYIKEMLSTIFSYKSKFVLMMNDLKHNDFSHFPNIEDHLKSYPKTLFEKGKYITEIDTVLNELEARFIEYQNVQEIVQYMAWPFKSDLDVKKTAALLSEIFGISKLSLENEIIKLQNDFF